MSQTVNLKNVGNKFRQLVQSLLSSNEECEVKDGDGRTVAVVLSASRYEAYQAYLLQKEADFGVFDDVADAFKDLSSEDLQSRIDQAVDEVKILPDPKHTTS